MIPYVYQKTPHQRQLNPGPFKRYQTYKQYLRTEFDRKCVYCRAPDGPKTRAGYHVDHYRPKVSFPWLLMNVSAGGNWSDDGEDDKTLGIQGSGDGPQTDANAKARGEEDVTQRIVCAVFIAIVLLAPWGCL